jgi:imidazolonepropionase-like amidohydrolase
MRFSTAVAFTAALALACGSTPPREPSPPAPPATIAYVGATLWDGTGRPAIADAVLVVEQGRVRAAGPRASTEIPPDAGIVDVAGRWIMPGLIDAHVHFFQSGGIYTRPDGLDLRSVRPYADEIARVKASLDETFRRWLAVGVTAVVDVGGPMWNFDVRDKARATADAPHVAVAGPLISSVERPQLDLGDPPIVRVTDPAEARARVARMLASGPDLVKIWYIADDDAAAVAYRPVVDAVVETAHQGGVRVAVHATTLASARHAVEAGADVLVHNVNDVAVDEAFVALARERRVIVIPTLVVFDDYARVYAGAMTPTALEVRFGSADAIASWKALPGLFDGMAAGDPRLEKRTKAQARLASPSTTSAENLRRLHAGGVTIAAGSDAGNIGTLHGAGFHRELHAMKAAGLSNEQVLLSATRDAARVFAPEPDLGTLEVGKRADFLVLRADPLADLANLAALDQVARDGKIFRPDQLVPVR